VAFIAALLDSNVRFKCADMPEADRTFLQMIAVFAEYERQLGIGGIPDAPPGPLMWGIPHGPVYPDNAAQRGYDWGAYINPAAWDAMVAGWPEADVKDLRTPEDIEANERSYHARNYKKLVQFPEIEEKPNRRK
jgi:hypothetical protein